MSSKNRTTLPTPWSFWYYSKRSQKKKKLGRNESYDPKMVGTVRTLQDFARLYLYLKPPSELPNIADIYFFRGANRNIKPLWENYPNGGCWSIRLRHVENRSNQLLNQVWEELIFAAVCEDFNEPDVVGIAVSRRTKAYFVSVWNATCDNEKVTSNIIEKMRILLGLKPDVIVQYKANHESMKDGSTHKNALFFRVRRGDKTEEEEEKKTRKKLKEKKKEVQSHTQKKKNLEKKELEGEEEEGEGEGEEEEEEKLEEEKIETSPKPTKKKNIRRRGRKNRSKVRTKNISDGKKE